MRTPEWQAERSVDTELAAELVGAQFPQLRAAPVEPLDAGWDNTVHLVGRTWVFRFPRRTVAVAALRREIAVLPGLAARLPLPVPVPELVGRPTSSYPWPFYGCRLVPGTELAAAGLPDTARTAAATGAGRFLRALHETTTRGTADLPVDPLRRGYPDLRGPAARERLERLAARGLYTPDPDVEALLGDAAGLGMSQRAPVLVHGDLHVRHLLVDRDGEACGVIDWGDVCRGDPSIDLALAYSGFAGEARTAFLDSYGEVDRATELRARVLALFLSAALAEYAAADGRTALLAEALAGVRRAVS